MLSSGSRQLSLAALRQQRRLQRVSARAAARAMSSASAAGAQQQARRSLQQITPQQLQQQVRTLFTLVNNRELWGDKPRQQDQDAARVPTDDQLRVAPAPEPQTSGAATSAELQQLLLNQLRWVSQLPAEALAGMLARLPLPLQRALWHAAKGFGRFSKDADEEGAGKGSSGSGSEPPEKHDKEDKEAKREKEDSAAAKSKEDSAEPQDTADYFKEFRTQRSSRSSRQESKSKRKKPQPKSEEDDEAHEEEDNSDSPKFGSPEFWKDSMNGNTPEGKKMRSVMMAMAAALLVSLLLAANANSSPRGTWQGFYAEHLTQGTVTRITIDQHGLVQVYSADMPRPVYSFVAGTPESFERKLEAAQAAMGIPAADYIPVELHRSFEWGSLFFALAPVALIVGVIIWTSRGLKGLTRGNMFGGVGKSKATVILPGDKNFKKVTFKDVAGMDETKAEIMEFVNFLKDPSKFTRLGAKIPRGALLVGPPGTGKTLLAKATAGEASVPFFSISGSDFIEMFVGVGPSRVRDLFKQARAKAPSIIFIDEIDAVGRARGGRMGGGNEERENTLNQMLVEMDGFNTTEGVVVLAGTNRADILDPALLRPGRFDRQIDVTAPDIKGREEIFMVHLRPLTLAEPAEFVAKRMSALTPGFVGADIHNICNEAALLAAREEADSVRLTHFERAIDRVIGGLEKKNILSAEERKVVAYHEAGHAVTGWFLENTDPLLKVTIVPHSKGALGFAQYLPKEVSLYQKEQLLDTMVMALGGRAAEQVFFGRVSTGAQNDLQKVTEMAYRQIVELGMNERVGNLSFPQYRPDQGYFKPFGEQMATAIDQEVQEMVRVAYDRALNLLTEHKDKVEGLATRLLEVETVSHEAIVEVLGPRPHVTPDYQRYLDNLISDKEKAKEKEQSEAASAQ